MRRTCCGKVAYSTRPIAQTAMREVLIYMADAHPAKKRPRRTYQCDNDSWHFSSWPDYSDAEARRMGMACAPTGDTVVAVAHRLVMERDGYHCVLCHAAQGLKVWTRGEMLDVLAHIPVRAERSAIRRTSPGNLITLCSLCKEFRDAPQFRDRCIGTGLLLERDDDPVATAIHWNRRWVYLNDDGTVSEWGQVSLAGG